MRALCVRPLLSSLLCVVAWCWIAGEEAVLAQRRVPVNAQVETPSQRLLPLPEGGSTDLRQQVEWLRQLQGLLKAGGELPKLPPIDAEQVKLLREAMKQFGGGRPAETQPPLWDGVSPEQMSKALADPALREQVRKALEQFQREGRLPRDEAASDAQGVPFPSRQSGQGRIGARTQAESSRPSTGAAEDSSAMPQALQDLLKRLSPQTDRASKDVPSEREPTGGAAAFNPPEAANPNAPNRNSASPDTSPMTSGGSRANGRIPANGQRSSGEAQSMMERSATVPSNSGRPDPGRSNTDRSNTVTRPEARSQTRSTEPNPLEDRRRSEREPKMTEPQISPSHEPRMPESDQASPAGSSRGTTEPPGATPPAGLSPQGSSRDSNSSRPSASRTPDPRSSTNDATSGTTQRDATPSGTRRLGTAADDSMNRKPMSRDPAGRRFPNGDATPPDERVASRERSPRSSTLPLNPEPTPLESRSGSSRPSMDVRSELEQQGFARTLQKLVEQAREESLAAPNGAPGASGRSRPVIEGSRSGLEGTAGEGGSSAGPQGSLSRIRDGFRKGLNDTATESRSNPVATRGQTDIARTTPSVLSAIERPPTLSNVTKAANTLLSDIATAPAPRTTSARSSGSVTSGGTTVSQGADSRSMFGLLMLLAVMGLAWYFAPRWIAAMSASPRQANAVGDVIHPADILSRVDVVRAFHQFALRPATMAAEWWTHRAVEQQVAQVTPALQPAIQTLTDLYEQARYLPDDADFTPDQIGTARQALEQCEASQPAVG